MAGEPVSVIGETLHFKGELSAGEDLVIEGKVEGTINQGKCCLTVKPKGQLIANVNATKIFIEGKVTGDLSATVSVTVRESGVVDGNIIAPRVAITEGATFNGNIQMRNPKDKADR
jgi:cytoskeletal protein CcmA (bactofilin family)